MRSLLYICTIIAAILLSNCKNSNEITEDVAVTKDSITQANNHETEKIVSSVNERYSMVALNFINSYVDNCEQMNESSTSDWILANSLSSNNLKSETKKIYEEAYKQDPELGLDFDPVFNAQDYPEEGFEIDSIDEKTGYIVVRGKKWKDFKLTMKLINEQDQWHVDGCGIINIPKRMQQTIK